MYARREKYQSIKKAKSLCSLSLLSLPSFFLLPPSLPSQAIVLPQKLMMRIELASMLQHVEGRILNSVALYIHTYVLHVKLIAYFP